MDEKTVQATEPARFDSKRIFFQSSLDGNNSGWFISFTSDRAFGPFADKETAQYILDGLVRRGLGRHHLDSEQRGSSSASVA